jgi:hypothetical protein
MERLQLNPADEAKVDIFKGSLARVVGLDDMFPPEEEDGMREPSTAPRPKLPPAVAVGEVALHYSEAEEPLLVAAQPSTLRSRCRGSG